MQQNTVNQRGEDTKDYKTATNMCRRTLEQNNKLMKLY